MRSTMQDFPLTVRSIVAHGTSVHGDHGARTVLEPGRVGRVTYAETGARAARLAGALRRLGVVGDQRVATFQWSNQQHLEAYAAVPAMGAVLHTLNIRLAADQVAYIANHAEDQVIIVDDSLIPLLAGALPKIDSVHTVLVNGNGDVAALEGSGKQILRYEEVLAAESEEFGWPAVDERDAASMCYTSGTTGNPKGVVYSHRSLWLHSQAACTAQGFSINADDTILTIVPMFHANAWGLPYAALMSGANLLLPGPFLQAATLVRTIDRERPTVSGAVPTIWNDILNHLRSSPGADLSSLRLVLCGGSAVPRSLMEAFDKEFGVRILHAWGMTETSPLAAIARPPAGLDEEETMRFRVTQGRPIAGVDLRIVDDNGVELPADGKSIGELEVRGPWVTGGYYRDDDPEKFHDGWLRTGDIGRVDPLHYVTLTDRTKDVIKSGGEWISSVELENTIIGHPDVLQAAVIGVPDERWQERPLAVVVLREEASASAEELRAWLTGRVAKWWLPENWSFVDAVPLTATGKYDKKVLRRQHAEQLLTVQTI
ncbi:long-chain fatty acid--CoA ligase [Frankia sp. CiP1_Cm_nod2]|uniref:long-chain fatty acid--CoA ligase n=1 Tax=Frankia sp. CiP1_Cm_nod2 TaxID=2897161 RepID=UPI0040448CF5